MARRKPKPPKKIGAEKIIFGGKVRWTSLVHFGKLAFAPPRRFQEAVGGLNLWIVFNAKRRKGAKRRSGGQARGG